MLDHVTGIHFTPAPMPRPAPSLYATMRAQGRHLYSGRPYKQAETHAEAMARYGFRVTRAVNGDKP
jgi:hypothetical protein